MGLTPPLAVVASALSWAGGLLLGAIAGWTLASRRGAPLPAAPSVPPGVLRIRRAIQQEVDAGPIARTEHRSEPPPPPTPRKPVWPRHAPGDCSLCDSLRRARTSSGATPSFPLDPDRHLYDRRYRPTDTRRTDTP